MHLNLNGWMLGPDRQPVHGSQMGEELAEDGRGEGGQEASVAVSGPRVRVPSSLARRVVMVLFFFSS